MNRHAGLIARRLGGEWRGALIEGPSGGGKSDLALRALAEGWKLAADDRTTLFVSHGRLFGRAPEALRGLIEVRGLGVVATPALAFAEIVLLVRCRPSLDAVQRLPDPMFETLLDVTIPVLDLWPFEVSATAKLNRAIECLGPGRQPV